MFSTTAKPKVKKLMSFGTVEKDTREHTFGIDDGTGDAEAPSDDKILTAEERAEAERYFKALKEGRVDQIW